MLKKLFSILALFALFSLACFIVLLLYNNTNPMPYFSQVYLARDGNENLSRIIEESVQKLLQMESAGQEGPKEMPAAGNSSLGPCPDKPPNLVGPLYVEFNQERSLDEIRQQVGTLVQDGGRYKPTDCIAQQKVAIIIPFRNRHDHLRHWLYYLHPILQRQLIDYGIYVINQDGEGVFNRAKLMNVGFVEALNEYDYDCFVFSDVDLVPLDDRNLYKCFDSPRHLAVAMDKFNFGLPYNTFFGGVSSLSRAQYLRINGFPNTYWGWGGEDDDIYNRIYFRGMSISRPDYVTGKYKMIKHLRDLHNEANPKNPDKLVHTRTDMDIDGINTLNYTVMSIVKEPLFTFISVDIDAPLN